MSEFRYLTTQLWQSGILPNPVIAEIPFTNVNFTQQLNSIGTFTGDILLSGVDVAAMNIIAGTEPGQTILYVQFGDNLVWSGVIWQRDWDSATQKLSIRAQEILSYFQKRLIVDNISYTAQDPCYIAGDLITYAQGKSHGNIGVLPQVPPVTSGYSITRQYPGYEYKTIYQAIKDLSNSIDTFAAVPFFDYAIIPSFSTVGGVTRPVNTFTMGSPYLENANNKAVFQLPGNIVEYSYGEDATVLTNKVYALGYGAGANKTVAIGTDDGTGGTLSATGTAAVIEKTSNYIDIRNKDLLKAVALGEVNALSKAPVSLQLVIPSYIDPYFGSMFAIGDFVDIIIKDDRFPSGLYTKYRIVAIDAAPGENGPDRITVTLTLPLTGTGTVS